MLSTLLSLTIIVMVALALGRHDLGTEVVGDMLHHANLPLLLLSWLFMTIAFLFLGMRWRALIPAPYSAPGHGLAAILCAGLLLNTALPGPVGEFGAAWFAHRRYRIPLALSLAAGVGARLLGMVMAATAAALIWLLVDLPVPEQYVSTLTAATFAVATAAICGVVMIIRPGWWRWVAKVTVGRARGESLPARVCRRLDEVFGEVAEAIEALRGLGWQGYARCLGWSFFAHLFVLIGIAIAAWSLGADVSVPGLVFTYATTTAAVVVMFLLPGSHVGWDAIFMSLLITTAGLGTADALGMAVLVRIQQLTVMAGGAGVLAYLMRVSPPDDAAMG